MKVRIKQHPEKIKARGQLGEHPFGALKRAMGHGYFLTKGIEWVSAEMSLSVLSYHIKRVLNIMGIKELMAALQALQKVVPSFYGYLYLLIRQKYRIQYFLCRLL